MTERCERMSGQTSKWPNTNVPVSRGSESLCQRATAPFYRTFLLDNLLYLFYSFSVYVKMNMNMNELKPWNEINEIKERNLLKCLCISMSGCPYIGINCLIHCLPMSVIKIANPCTIMDCDQ